MLCPNLSMDLCTASYGESVEVSRAEDVSYVDLDAFEESARDARWKSCCLV